MPNQSIAERRAVSPRAEKRGKRGSWQSAIILEIEPRTPSIRSVFVAPSQPFSFIPGQYLSMRVMADGALEARKYSIASAPESGAILELAIQALYGGKVSGYVHRIATASDVVEVRGPRGDFTWTVADGGPVLMIAGGSGLAPLMSMIRHRVLRRSNVPVGLVYSAATREDVLFRDELLGLAAARDGFELTLTLTRESRSEAGSQLRRIDRAMLEDMLVRLPGAVSRVLICGSDPFVDNARGLVAQLGIAGDRVLTESFGV